MLSKLARIFGIVGGALTLLPYLLFLAKYVSLNLTFHFESDKFASGFLVVCLVPMLITLAGLIGIFLVRKKHTLAGVLMLASGILTIGFPSILYTMLLGTRAIPLMNNPVLVWLQKLPQLLLIAAGVLALLYRPIAALTETQQTPPSDNAE